MQEVTSLQYELTNAQRQTLSTLDDYKKAREANKNLSTESAERIESLLNEINKCKEKTEIFEQAVTLFPKQIEGMCFFLHHDLIVKCLLVL